MGNGKSLKSILLLIAILMLIAPLFIGKYLLFVMTMIFVNAFTAGAWNLMAGYGGLLSFGHAAFLGLGSYTTALLYIYFGTTPWIGMWSGAFLATLTGFALAWSSFRYKLKGVYFALATMLVAEILRIIATNADFTGYSQGLQIPLKYDWKEFQFDEKTLYWIGFILVMGMLLFTWRFSKSVLGRRLVATRENEDAAASLGVNLLRTRIIIICLSAFLTSIGGAFNAFFMRMILPDMDFGLHTSITMMIGTLAGGQSTVFGPLIGTTIISFVMEELGSLGTKLGIMEMFSITMVIYGIILSLLIAFLPQGLMGVIGKWRVLQWVDKEMETIKEKASGREGSQPVFEFSGHLVESSKLDHRMIKAENIIKDFGGLRAINNFSMHINRGEIVGLIGPNGSGKTTLFNVITGFYAPDGGVIEFQDKKISNLKPHQICEMGIGRTFQIAKSFEKLPVIENVLIGNLVRPCNHEESIEKAFNILNYVGLKDKWARMAGELTVIERKRLELARALATEPTFLLLDEVMAGLNPKEHDAMIQLVREIHKSGVTLLVIEHTMKVIMALSHRIVVLNYGMKIAEGTPQEIQNNPTVIETYLGKE